THFLQKVILVVHTALRYILAWPAGLGWILGSTQRSTPTLPNSINCQSWASRWGYLYNPARESFVALFSLRRSPLQGFSKAPPSGLPSDIGLPGTGQDGDEHQTPIATSRNHELRPDTQHNHQRIWAWVLK